MSSVYVKGAVADPSKTQLSITITMDLVEWIRFRGQLASAFPSWRVSQSIGKVIQSVHQAWTEEVEVDDD